MGPSDAVKHLRRRSDWLREKIAKTGEKGFLLGELKATTLAIGVLVKLQGIKDWQQQLERVAESAPAKEGAESAPAKEGRP